MFAIANFLREGLEIIHSTEICTRYCESDALGHINSVSYFIYLEQARVDFIMDEEVIPNIEDWPFILASIHCDYKQQIYVKENLIIKTWVIELGRSSFKLAHEICSQGSDEVLAYGEAVLVHFDFNHQKSSIIPDAIRTKLKKYFIENT